MKKQVALLLATVMTLALLPVNALAATNNFVDNRLTVPDGSAIMEHGINGNINRYLYPKPSNYSGGPDWYVDGTDLVVPLQRDVQTGYQFKLTLSNAKWFFRDGVATKDFVTNQPSVSTYDPAKGTYTITKDNGDAGIYNRTTSPGALTYISGVAYTEANYQLEVSTLNNNIATVTVKAPPSAAAYNQSGAIFNPPASPATEGTYSGNWIFRIPLVTYISDSNIEATVTVDPGNASTVTSQKIIFANTASGKTNSTANSVVTSKDVWDLDTFVVSEMRVGSIRNGEYITLSLPSGYHFTQNWGNGDNDLKVGVESGLGWGNGSTGYGTYVESTINSSNKVVFDGSNKNFSLQYGNYSTTNDKLGVNYLVGGQDDSVLTIYLGEITPSTQLRGSVYIDNMQIWVDEGNTTIPYDIKLSVKDQNNITGQDVLVAQRVEWALNLETTSTVPTLVSGRYIGPSWDGMDADDNTHKTASIKLSENAATSWWGARTTVLAMPATDDNTVKGAKFRKVRITDSDKFDVPSNGVNLQDYRNISALYSSGLNYQRYGSSSAVTTANSVPYNVADAGTFLNDGERHIVTGNYGAVTVDYNKITLSNMKLKPTEKAWIKFDLWVSIEYGFGRQSGDLKLSVDPSSTSLTAKEAENPASVVIAHVKDPVEVVTTVSDLKIGYQYQTTADIQIKENFAHALLKDKTVKVSVTDLISSDMNFTNDTKIAVTSGDLKLKNIIAAGQGGFTSQSRSWLDNRSYAVSSNVIGGDGAGSISFDIDRESTVASTITISNVAVKLDRTIPVTNKNAYQVVVWGTA
ncbi:MAG: hypothetical protein FWC60_10000, partial [Firmicutes bacterium]|nr:hypothetical protein [Bacillota bacterium]